MSCISIESIGSTQVNYQIGTIVSCQLTNNGQIFSSFPQFSANLHQQSLSSGNLDTLILQKTGECILVFWVEVIGSLSNSFLPTKYIDTMKIDSVKIDIVDLIGIEFCIATEDGRKLYDEISRNIKEKKKVVISFDGVKFLTPAFFNVSICQLYAQFEENIINEYLVVSDLEEVDKKILSIPVTKAKRYFKNTSP